MVQFYTTPPVIDSFPIVKTTISVAYNGRPAPINSSHLSVLEDGRPTPFQLLDCDESDSASIAMLVDVSESMKFTLWKGSDEFYQAFSVFANSIYTPSEFALIPFNDTVARILPATYRNADYFKAGDPSDIAEFIDSIGGLQFAGNTDVDYAIRQAALHLTKAVHRRKAIVLVTDDAIYDYEGLIALLKLQNIALFVLELDADTIRGNIITANETGGKFFSPRDSTEIAPMMLEIAAGIFAKKCTLRYVSTHPCPWWSRKTLWVGLNFQMMSLTQTHYFELGPNRRDSIAPSLRETYINEVTRIVSAQEDFPCDRGIMAFTDSALVNFAKLTRARDLLPISAYDYLVVADPSQSAHGWYIATDSNGNTERIAIQYTPPPDLLPPVWSNAAKSGPDQTLIVATELRKNDRGIKQIALLPTSQNARIDSVLYPSHKIAHVYVSRIDPAAEAAACLTAIDSVGNDSNICLYFYTSDADLNPPVIGQTPTSSPYLTIDATITEWRTGDRGIAEVVVIPVANVSGSSTAFTNVYAASASIAIADSLYPAQAIVLARDSAGNEAERVLTYEPLPDSLAPEHSIVSIDNVSSALTITEMQAWDRGIASVTLVQGTNVSTTKTSDSRRVMDWQINSVDPYIDGIARFSAEDSAGNVVEITVVIPAQTKPGLKPLTYADPLDFGTVAAPAYAKRTLTLSNPNGEDITLVSAGLLGDDSVLAALDAFPVTVSANGSIDLSFEYTPTLLGDWQATYTIETVQGTTYPIRLKGSSTGIITAAVSHEAVKLSGETGELTIAFSGIPDVSNLDTLQFRLSLNEDVAVLSAPTSTCSNTNWLCNYALGWSDNGEGTYSFQLVRKSEGRSLDLGASPSLKLPFKTYLSEDLSTDVTISDGSATRSTFIGTAGSISVGEACGDPVIRASLERALPAEIRSLKVGAHQLTAAYFSGDAARVQVMVIDILGSIVYERSSEVTSGMNTIVMPVEELASGQYRLLIRSNAEDLSSRATVSRPFTVLR